MDPNSRMFRPLKVGRMTLSHRIVMSPMTRYRATEDHVPKPCMVEYYAQRAAVPGTLLIGEATMISNKAGGDFMVPGIWSQEQIDAWRQIVDAVHRKGSFIYCQLWSHGRASLADYTKTYGGKLLAPSPIRVCMGDPESDCYYDEPEAMTEEDIRERISEYVAAAKNAMAAGFDGVELHAANGFLIDQFLQDVSNHRTDGWGGTIEKRSRFAVEVTEAVAAVVGGDRTGIKFSPFSLEQSMGMKNPIPQMTDVVTRLLPLNLAYINLARTRLLTEDPHHTDNLETIVKIWPTDSPVFLGCRGGSTLERAIQIVDERPHDNAAVAIGRPFISNPDLPFRAQRNVPWAAYDRSTFYTNDEAGYTDYPYCDEFKRTIAGEA